jgi:hypothetical protein
LWNFGTIKYQNQQKNKPAAVLAATGLQNDSCMVSAEPTFKQVVRNEIEDEAKHK